MSKIPNVNAAIVAGIREGQQELELTRLRAVAGADTTAYLRAAANAAAAGVKPALIEQISRAIASTPVILPQPTDRLPLLCRIRRHTWRRNINRPGGWYRDTCDRCRHLDLPAPTR